MNRAGDLRRGVKHVPELDGIRGIAILLVVTWHYFTQIETVPGTVPAYAMRLLSFTWAGVDLFFVLSGFLIGGTLLDHRTSATYFRTFYIRRACRILPLYGLVLGVFCAALWLGPAWPGTPGGSDWRHALFGDPLPFWSYATFTQNFAMARARDLGPTWMSVTWSLAVEEQFYLIIPLVIRFVRVDRLPAVLGAAVLAAPALRTLLYASSLHSGLAGYVLLPGRWDALLLGVLGAYALRRPHAHARLRRALPAIRVTVACAAVIVFALLVAGQGIGSAGMSVGGHTVLAVLGLGVIGLALQSDGGRTQALFRHPVLVWCGAVSYGVYLFHLPVAGLLHGLLRHQAPRIAGPADAMVTVLALGGTFLLAAASLRFVEGPMVRIGQRANYEA